MCICTHTGVSVGVVRGEPRATAAWQRGPASSALADYASDSLLSVFYSSACLINSRSHLSCSPNSRPLPEKVSLPGSQKSGEAPSLAREGEGPKS